MNISDCVVLNDGNSIPLFGLGCYKMNEEQAKTAVTAAVKNGYLLFDTAILYENEQYVADALRKFGLRRDAYFIVTKLPSGHHGYENAKMALKKSLKTMKLDYIDLFLIHSPESDKLLETWKAFCELKSEGLAKSIGVSNFNVQHLRPIIDSDMLVPAVNQIELHPWNQNNDVVSFCAKNSIAIMAYSPLARGRVNDKDLSPVVDKLGKKYEKSNAQIVLRWSIQKGYVTIPKSKTPSRIVENCGLYEWSISAEDMIMLDSLERGLEVCIANSTLKLPFIN